MNEREASSSAGARAEADSSHGASPWWRHRGLIAVAALLVGFALGTAGGEADGELVEARARIEVLTAEVEQLSEEIDAGPGEDATGLTEQVEELERRNGELSSALEETEAALDEARDELERVRAELASAEEELAQREAELATAEEELAQREADLERRAAALEQHEDGGGTATASGCAPGQVDVNSASVTELQRIHQVGPDRAQQIVDLRPFRSLDDLTRVSGIGPSHRDAIKGQGLACVD